MLVISVTGLSGRWFPPFALLLYTLGSGGLFLSGQLEPALACAWLNGFGAGSLILYINTSFAQQVRGAALVNLLNGTFAVGTIVGALGAGWTISTGHPYGLLAVALGGVVCYRALRVQDWPDVHGTEAAGPSHAPGHRVSGWNLLPFLLLYTCYGGLETGVGGWAATHLQSQGFSAADAARILAAFWAATALAKFITLLFADKVPEGTIVTAGLIGTTAALALASMPNMGAIGYIATGLALGPIFPTGLAWLAKLGGDRRSIGLTTSASMTGSIVFPTLIGWSFGKDTVTIPLSLVAIGLCATATVAWIRRPLTLRRARV